MTQKLKSQDELAACLGKAIAAKRKQQGLTQGQLAEKVGVETETISRVERGVTVPSLLTLKLLADALDQSMAAFLEESRGTSHDQAAIVQKWLEMLAPADRLLVMSHLEALCFRLAR